jgi:Holliday junction DNA helicase RuvA
MIVQIYGKVCQINQNSLVLELNGLCYEVLVPTTILIRIVASMPEDRLIRLVTYHYHQVEPSRSTPVLIGFSNKLEKEFFELFISVSGIGPRAAIKAINQPISVIAQGIYRGDIKFLTSLPGIGQQKAKNIVASLQDKVARFGLLQDAAEKKALEPDIETEALQVLEQLQYNKQEAKEMIKRALQRSPAINAVSELLNEVYRERKIHG